MEYMERLTKREFRELRNKLGWSQEQLAKAMMLGANGRRTIRRWETEPTAHEKARAAAAGKPAGFAIPGPAQGLLVLLAGGDLQEFHEMAGVRGPDTDADDTSED